MSINKVILIGNLGADPEIRHTQSGDAVATLSIATSEKWKDKNNGEAREQTEWHRVIFWRRTAEICGEYLRKGSKIYVEGKLKTRKWQDKDGKDRWTTEIQGRDMQMLDSKGAGTQTPARPGHPDGQVQAPAQTPTGDPEPAFDKDIPF